MNPLQHSVKISHQLLIAKSDDTVALRFQRSGAATIAGQFSRCLVGNTINLDYQLCFTTTEVCKKGPIATCRENFTPPSCRLRRQAQSLPSAFVCSRRNDLARAVDFWFGPRMGNPWQRAPHPPTPSARAPTLSPEGQESMLNFPPRPSWCLSKASAACGFCPKA